jgi:hypothetical protein
MTWTVDRRFNEFKQLSENVSTIGFLQEQYMLRKLQIILQQH